MPYLNIQRQREYQRRWVKRRREKYIKLYGGKCKDCGSTNDLQFNHIDRTKKKSHRVFSWSEDRIQEELSKCELLCVKCHAEKTRFDLWGERIHGKDYMYKLGCRCAECKMYNRDKKRNWRAKKKAGGMVKLANTSGLSPDAL